MHNYKCCYTNIRIKKAIYVGDYYKKNILRLGAKLLHHKKIKIIIIGTLCLDPVKAPKFNIDREVEIYNIIIKLISKKYGIDSNEIWYKSSCS